MMTYTNELVDKLAHILDPILFSDMPDDQVKTVVRVARNNRRAKVRALLDSGLVVPADGGDE